MKGKKIEYSSAELSWLSDNRRLTISEYCSEFNARFNRNLNKSNLSSLRKRKGWRTGRTGHFQKGQTSHNKGKKQSEYMSAQAIANSKTTLFKTGNVPVNIRPMYYERISADGYIEIKVPEPNPYTGTATRFRQKHRWLWENANGPIPKDQVLRFKDGNKTNCQLSNLELIPRGVNAILNKRGYEQMPDEIKPTVKLLAHIENKQAQLRRAKEA